MDRWNYKNDKSKTTSSWNIPTSTLIEYLKVPQHFKSDNHNVIWCLNVKVNKASCDIYMRCRKRCDLWEVDSNCWNLISELWPNKKKFFRYFWIGSNEMCGLLLKAIDLLQLQLKFNVNTNRNQLFRRQSKFRQIGKQHAIDTFRRLKTNSIPPPSPSAPLRVHIRHFQEATASHLNPLNYYSS